MVLAIIQYKSDKIKKASINDMDVPYGTSSISMSISCDDLILFVEFTGSKTNIYCNNFGKNKSRNVIFDNIDKFAKENFNLLLKKHSTLSVQACGEIVNFCGGIAILDKNGEEKFILGNDFITILTNEESCEYISYLFGELLRLIFEQETFHFLYNYSDMSYIDLINNKKFLKNSLKEITCLESEAIIEWKKLF